MLETIKVGDVVPWADVPDGALVRYGDRYYVRLPGDRGWWVGATGRPWAMFGRGPAIPGESEGGRREKGWTWSWHSENDPVTIVALGLTGRERADDLQRLAEVFEVREALDRLLVCPYCNNEEPTIGELEDGTISQPWCTECDTEMGEPNFVDEAERLHAAGWRPGMTAEDAARLLAAKEAT